MLASYYRFHGYGALRYVYKNGLAKRGSIMTVKSVRNERRKKSRVAVVVSKKVLKSAVGRNRIRRRVYELIRHELPHISANHDIVCIITSPEARTIEGGQLKTELQKLFANLKLYNESK